jgi:hypothetical protein
VTADDTRGSRRAANKIDVNGVRQAKKPHYSLARVRRT